MNYILCGCHKDKEFWCMDWDGKGSTDERSHVVKENCQSTPDKCSLSAKPIKREGCEWLWKENN